MAKFDYNNSKNASTSHTPLELNCDYYLWIFFENKCDAHARSSSANRLAVELRELMNICRQNLLHAQDLQKLAYDKRMKFCSYAYGFFKIQSVALYGSELWWKGQKSHQQVLQKLFNRQARSITGLYQSTPMASLMSKSGLTPAHILLDFQQRRYAYRILSLPDNVPTKSIFPHTLRVGDGNDQPGEQPEDDLYWITGRQIRTYGQYLARQVSVNFSIDPAEGVEPILEASKATFPRNIVIEEKNQCDGSKRDESGTGAAVIWKENAVNRRWQERKVSLGKNKEILDAEMWGISEALKVAEQKAVTAHPLVIDIFCDSQTAINKLKSMSDRECQALKTQIYHKTKLLIQQGHKVSVCWVSSHSGLEGNEKADAAAKKAAMERKTQTAKWLSLSHIKRMQIYPLLGKTKKTYAARFYQLKVGHGAIGTFFKQIGAADSAECWWCGDVEQSVMHLYTKWRKWRTERRFLKKSLKKVGIQWQRRPEKKWLAELLANRYGVGPLLEFLKETKVGSRGRAVEKAVQWARRRDQEGEDQLGDCELLGVAQIQEGKVPKGQ